MSEVGAEARRTSCPRGGGQEELAQVRGQGQRPGRAIPYPRSGVAAKSARLRQSRSSRERSYPTPEARGGSQEELPHIQGAMAAQAQEGLEELIHVQGQEGQW